MINPDAIIIIIIVIGASLAKPGLESKLKVKRGTENHRSAMPTLTKEDTGAGDPRVRGCKKVAPWLCFLLAMAAFFEFCGVFV